jgi:molybdopterin-guanine dinucleotide biosynthesis protein A
MSENDLIGEIPGIVLAGGRATRMGGGDKGLLVAGGKPLLARMIERLSPQVARLALNANGDPERFAAFGLPVLGDDIEGFQGPLAGILTGLRWSKTAAPGARYVLTTPADVPILPDDLVARLARAASGANATQPVLASSGEPVRTHPTIGLWPVGLADDIADALARGERAVHRFAESKNAIAVAFPPCDIGGRRIDPFFNVNTPDDLAVLKSLLE